MVTILTRPSGLLTAEFTPKDLPRLEQWLDGSYITGLANNDPLGAWNDRAKSNGISQGTASKRPTYLTGLVNGRAGARLDGADDFIAGGMTELPQPWSAWLVAKHRTGSSAGNETMLGGRDGASAAVGLVVLGVNTWRLTAGANLDNGTADAAWHVFIVVANGASSVIEVDGVAVTGNAGTRALAYTALGAAHNETDHADVDVVSSGVCGAGLDAIDRRYLRRWLGRRFSVAVGI